MFSQLSATDNCHHQLISILDILLARIDTETKKKRLQEEHNLPMTIKLEKEMKEMNDMCNLSAGIREEGFREGERKDERKGKRKGERKGKLETLRNMIVDGLTTIEALKATGRYTEDELSAVTASLH